MPESKVSDELSAIIAKRPVTEVAIIVALREDSPLDDIGETLKGLGLRIEKKLGGIKGGPTPVITGSTQVKDIPKLAAVPEVEKIEYDGKTYTL